MNATGTPLWLITQTPRKGYGDSHATVIQVVRAANKAEVCGQMSDLFDLHATKIYKRPSIVQLSIGVGAYLI